MDDNPKVQDGIPVIAIVFRADNSSLCESAAESMVIDTTCKVYLGTRGVNHHKLTSELMAAAFFKDGFYSPCNMFIARHQVKDELCSWMFPIIFALADHVGTREDSYQNRYPGFISERLITYFFESRRDKYRVVYADKNFLS